MLYTGLLVFFGIHVLTSISGLRSAVVAKTGERAYRLYFSLASFAGLALVCFGYNPQTAPLFAPVIGVYKYAYLYMPLAFILLASSHQPCHIKQWVRHPMLLGVLIWAVTHVLVNPDLHSVLLFGGFALYSIYAIISAIVRDKTILNKKPLAWKFDALAVAIGLVAYVAVIAIHNWLFGVPPILVHAG